MSRDHRKLRAFEIADALVTAIYRGSAFEMRYLTTLSGRLGLLSETVVNGLTPRLDLLCATLVKLVDALELEAAREAAATRGKRAAQNRAFSPEADLPARSPKPEA